MSALPKTAKGHKVYPASATTTIKPADVDREALAAVPTTTLSLKQLQQQLTAAKSKGKDLPVSTTIDQVTEKVEELALDVEAEDDPRTLEERLTEPTPEGRAAIAALIARQLQLGAGTVTLQLGPHNLHHKTLVSLLDGPDGPTASTAPSDAAATGLARAQVNRIVETLTAIVADVNADLSVLHNPFDDDGRITPVPKGLTETVSSTNADEAAERWRGKALRLLVRAIPAGAADIAEVRVAVVGNVDAGKSSLLGVLTKGRLDDGRGRARVSLFRHKHEVETGRTSSVGMELLGFTSKGAEVLPDGFANQSDGTQIHSARKQQLSWEEISAKSAKVVSFADLAGHEKYLKTTLFGLTATSPDFVLLIVGANAGLVGMSKEHLSVALALSVPVVCVVTKVDMTPAHITEATLKQLNKVLKSPGCRKQPVYVKDVGMACELAAGFVQAKACPIFLVSNVTGEGLSNLKTFLNVVPTAGERFPVDEPLEFSISDCFAVPFVGCVVSGVVLSGKVAIGDNVVIGPDSLGAFTATTIKSIQRKRVGVNSAEAGQSVSFALKRIKRSQVRKGQVILPKTDHMPVPTKTFEGQTLVLFHNSLISPRYSAMLHSGPIRQTVQIDSIADHACIRTGDRATVQYSFIKQPEWLKVGDRFLFREGRTRALGVVTKLLA